MVRIDRRGTQRIAQRVRVLLTALAALAALAIGPPFAAARAADADPPRSPAPVERAAARPDTSARTAGAEGPSAFRGDATRAGVYPAAAAPRTGALRWKFATGGKVYSSPAVAGDRVYFGSFDGTFYALNASDGTLAWKFETQGERRYTARHIHGALPAAESMPDPFDVFLSSPAVVDGVVYFGSGDDHVYALDAASGALRWKFATGDVVHASPAVVDGTLYVGSWDSWFYALDARTGAQRWRFKTGEDPRIHNQVGIQSSAVVANGVVYFGCRDSKLYAVDAATGRLRFAYDNRGSWVIGTPLVADGRVYFGTSDSGLLHSLDARSGAPAWKRSRNKWPMFSSPVLAGERLYVGTHEGRLLAIERASGDVAWTFQTDGSRANGARYTAQDGTPNYAAAYASAFYDDIVVGLDRLLSVGAVLSTPALHDGVAYFGSTDGNVYAVE